MHLDPAPLTSSQVLSMLLVQGTLRTSRIDGFCGTVFGGKREKKQLLVCSLSLWFSVEPSPGSLSLCLASYLSMSPRL